MASNLYLLSIFILIFWTSTMGLQTRRPMTKDEEAVAGLFGLIFLCCCCICLIGIPFLIVFLVFYLCLNDNLGPQPLPRVVYVQGGAQPVQGMSPPGMTPRMVPGMPPQAMTPGMPPQGMTPGMSPPGMTPGMSPPGMTPGMSPPGMTPGMPPQGMTPGMLSPVVTPGMSPPMVPQQFGAPYPAPKANNFVDTQSAGSQSSASVASAS